MASAHDSIRTARWVTIILVVYWLAMFVGTHIPTSLPQLPGSNLDKVVHFLAYSGLALLIALNWQIHGGHLGIRHYVLVWILLAAYAALDEWTQLPVGRDGNPYDWLADITGSAAGLAIFHAIRPWLFGRQQHSSVAVAGVEGAPPVDN